MSPAVTLYTTRFCPYCVRARQLLHSKGIAFDDIRVDDRPGLRREMQQRSGRRTVPQIWIGDRHIGGCDELYQLERSGRLDALLAPNNRDPMEEGLMAEEQAGTQEQPQQQFAVQRIYTKDLSFESPLSPGVFREQWSPQVNVELNTRSEKFDDDGNFEVVLLLTITAKQGERTAFLCEVQQAGVFLIRGLEGENLRRALGTAAPNILFPYARETIDALVVKGGFPAIMLAPVNFDALYQQALQRAAQKKEEDGATAH